MLARDGKRAAAAAAAAANFPAWGDACRRVLHGLRKDDKMAAELKWSGCPRPAIAQFPPRAGGASSPW